MGHPRWPGLDDKTGNPEDDNRFRQFNRVVWKATQRSLRVSAAGRKRKKRLLRVEGGRYIRLVHEAGRMFYERDHTNTKDAA